MENKFVPVELQKISRYQSFDTANVVITYSLDFIMDPADSTFSHDIQVLEIGDKYSKSYSKLLWQGDSIYCAYIDKGANSAPWFQEGGMTAEVFKAYEQKTSLVTYRLFGTYYVYYYDDDYPVVMNWKIASERQKILGYNCQKATGSFRGRDYEAWFTPEIPLSEGPYKFCGLPGLILKICDTGHQYMFSCIGIERPKEVVPIKMFARPYKKISREELQKMEERAFKHPYQYLKMYDTEFFVDTFDEEGEEKAKNISFPYNPIELE